MTEQSPVKEYRTLVGDSYGDVQIQDDPSNLKDDDKVMIHDDQTKNSNEEMSNNLDNDSHNSSVHSKIEHSGSVMTENEGIVTENESKSPNNKTLDVEETNKVMISEDGDEMAGNINTQSNVDIKVNESHGVEKDECVKEDDDVDDEENNSGETFGESDNVDVEFNNAKEESNENIADFMDEENEMDCIDDGNKPIKRTHSIHITAEVFDGDDDMDRQTPLSLYNDEDDGGSDLSPACLPTNRTSARSENRPQTTSSFCDVPGGLRAKANTPASFYNINNNVNSPLYPNEKVSARNSSRQSRDEVFHRAMTLMSNRCTSARGGDESNLLDTREPPFGVHIPQYFYVYQKKPQQIAPLKAWRGYKGNVYFQPMVIQKMKDASDDLYDSENVMPKQLPSRSMLRSAPLPHSRGSRYSNLRGLMSSSSSSRPYHQITPSNQMYVMDKAMLANSHNPNLSTDLYSMEGMESTGSLTISKSGLTTSSLPGQNSGLSSQLNKDKRLLQKRERICKGSNFHKTKDKSELRMGRDSKVYTVKISEPMKHLITPDNSRRTSGSSSKMSLRKQQQTKGIENMSSKLRRSDNKLESSLMVSGDKYSPLRQSISPTLGETDHLHPLTKSRVTMEDVDAYVNASDNLPPVSQVHVTLGPLADMDMVGRTTPFSEHNSSQDGSDSVDYLDMNFKELTTNVPVESGH